MRAAATAAQVAVDGTVAPIIATARVLGVVRFGGSLRGGTGLSRGLPTRDRTLQPLEFSAGIGHQDAKITEAGPGSPQTVGSPIYNVPDWTANTDVTYTAPLPANWILVSGADYSYVGRSYSANNDPADPRERPSYRLINARLALQRGDFEVALVGKNLADELTNLGDNRSIAAETPGRPHLLRI